MNSHQGRTGAGDKIVLRDFRHRVGQRPLVDRTVTDHHHGVEIIARLKRDLEKSPVADRQSLGDIPHITDLEFSSGIHLDGKSTVGGGRSAVGRALLDDIDADHRLARLVEDLAGHLDLGLGRTHANRRDRKAGQQEQEQHVPLQTYAEPAEARFRIEVHENVLHLFLD